MSTKKATKRALLTSILAICLCLVMLIGSTFAWFTDTASTNVNQIQSGKLDVDIVDTTEQEDSLNGGTLVWQKAGDHEGEKVLWEPNCTYNLTPFKIVNKGNLALKYKISITGLTGDAKLLEAIDFTVSVVDPGLTPLPAGEGAVTAVTQTTAKDLNNFEGTLLAGKKTGVITITGKMRADAGNEYQNLSIDSIGITVLATQLASEFDSINNTYDTDATYLNTEKDEDGNVTAYLVGTADELVYFAKTVNVDGEKYSGVTIKLTDDINLSGRNWTPIGTAAKSFASTFDGNGHTISGLTVNAREAAGLFGYMYGEVQNLKVTGATVTGNHWAGVIAGYSTANDMIISNCTVTGSTVSIAPELVGGEYDNGDKAGGIIGYCVYGDTVTNCTVEGCTIKGYRDIGGLIGYAYSGTTITGNSVKDCTLINDQSDNYKNYDSDEKFDVHEIVGEINGGGTLDASNTSENVTIQIVKPVSRQEDLETAISSGATNLKLAEGIYTLPGDKLGSKDVTITGTKSTIIDLSKGTAAHDATITVSGVTVKGAADNYKGIQHAKELTYKDCTLTGKQFLYANDVEFINCTFENSGDYCVWTYGSTNVLFDNCVFNTTGKAVLVYREGDGTTNVTANDCTFNGGSSLKAAIETGDNPAKTYVINLDITNATLNGYTKAWGNKNNMPTERLSVTLDGVKVY